MGSVAVTAQASHRSQSETRFARTSGGAVSRARLHSDELADNWVRAQALEPPPEPGDDPQRCSSSRRGTAVARRDRGEVHTFRDERHVDLDGGVHTRRERLDDGAAGGMAGCRDVRAYDRRGAGDAVGRCARDGRFVPRRGSRAADRWRARRAVDDQPRRLTRRELERDLRDHGCVLLREGARITRSGGTPTVSSESRFPATARSQSAQRGRSAVSSQSRRLPAHAKPNPRADRALSLVGRRGSLAMRRCAIPGTSSPVREFAP